MEKSNIIELTTPKIVICKSFIAERLYVPPSKCTISIHARFQNYLSKLLKHDLNPSNDEFKASPSMFEKARARMMAAPYQLNSSRAQVLANLKTKKRSEVASAYENGFLSDNLNNGRVLPDWKQKYASYLNSNKKWTVTNPKTKEELDAEIDKYSEITAKINSLKKAGKPIPQDLTDELNHIENALNNVKLVQSTPKSFSSRKSLKQKILNMTSEQLMDDSYDDDDDGHFDSSKKKLDDDLENYMRIARERREAKALRVSESLSSNDSLSSSRLSHESYIDGIDEEDDIEMNEY